MKHFILLLISFLFLTNLLHSQNQNGIFGIRAGLGTDINLGLGYGIGANYLLPESNVELTVVLFGNSSEETTEDFHTYEETTDLFVFGVMANYLFGYKFNQRGGYGIIGFGFSAISIDWEETSPTDGSLGPPLPNGGSKQSESGTGGGAVVNMGGGYSFGNFNLRAEFPVIIPFSPPGEASGVIPTFIVTAGYNF